MSFCWKLQDQTKLMDKIFNGRVYRPNPRRGAVVANRRARSRKLTQPRYLVEKTEHSAAINTCVLQAAPKSRRLFIRYLLSNRAENQQMKSVSISVPQKVNWGNLISYQIFLIARKRVSADLFVCHDVWAMFFIFSQQHQNMKRPIDF